MAEINPNIPPVVRIGGVTVSLGFIVSTVERADGQLDVIFPGERITLSRTEAAKFLYVYTSYLGATGTRLIDGDDFYDNREKYQAAMKAKLEAAAQEAATKVPVPPAPAAVSNSMQGLTKLDQIQELVRKLVEKQVAEAGAAAGADKILQMPMRPQTPPPIGSSPANQQDPVIPMPPPSPANTPFIPQPNPSGRMSGTDIRSLIADLD